MLAAISKMDEPYRSMARKANAIITVNAPELSPRMRYGMPAYA
jgi:uncharacterized protein YdhG (YjbR/CyaY superfamily)